MYICISKYINIRKTKMSRLGMSRECGNGCGQRTMMLGKLSKQNLYIRIKHDGKKKKTWIRKNQTNVWKKNMRNKKRKMQTATMPTNVTGMGALAGGVSGVPAAAMPGGLQSAGMASLELGKKRMRDSNDDLLMVPWLMHEIHFPFS